MIIQPHIGLWVPSSAAIFNPATLSLSGWWRASYGGAPWSPTASAGASGTDGNLVVGTAPSVGTAVGGLTPAAFNGSTQYLQTANGPGTYVTLGAGTIWVLAYVVSAPATLGAPYLDPCFLSTNGGGEVSVSYSSSGFVASLYDTAYETTTAISFTTGAYHLFQMTWNGTTLSARVDGGTAQTKAAGNIDTFGGLTCLNVGTNYNAGDFVNARILEVVTATSAFSTATADNYRSYANNRYGISV